MKNSKIVKRLTALVLATGIAVTISACAKKKGEEVVTDINGETIDPIVLEMVTYEGESETETVVGQIDVYDPVDFKEVVNAEVKYNELLELREEYNNLLISVCEDFDDYNEDEITAAVYNVVRIDNDLTSCMVKIIEQTRTGGKNEYADIQLEKLEQLLSEINSLREMITTSENLWVDHTDKMNKAEVEKVLKVKRFSEMALKAPVKSIEKDIKELKVEIETLNSKTN